MARERLTPPDAPAGSIRLDLAWQPVSGPRIVHRRLEGADAYDIWHLGVLHSEILECRRLAALRSLESLEPIPRKEKNLLAYLLLAARPGSGRVVELGSSLFELVDGLAAVAKFARDTRSPLPTVEIERLEYVGIEVSDLLARASIDLHPMSAITIVPRPAEATGVFDLALDRNVSSYAFADVPSLAEFLARSEASLLNLFVSLGETFVSTRLGKPLTYFGLAELAGLCDRPLFHLFGQRAPGPVDGPPLDLGRPAIEGFFLHAEEAVARRFLEIAGSDPAVRSWFEAREISLVPATRWLDDPGLARGTPR